MTTFVLIHGAGGSAWDWHLVAAQLLSRGSEVVAPDLPCDDDAAGLEDYVEAVMDAVGDAAAVGDAKFVVVGHSFAGFVAPQVAQRLRAALLVLVAPMIPMAGESPGQWWHNTGHADAQRAQAERDGWSADGGLSELFLHDVPEGLAAEALEHARDQSGTPFGTTWPLAAWPSVPTRVLVCTEDRMFPALFQTRVVQERLGITPDEMQGGHYVALSRPNELADRLNAYVESVMVDHGEQKPSP